MLPSIVELPVVKHFCHSYSSSCWKGFDSLAVSIPIYQRNGVGVPFIFLTKILDEGRAIEVMAYNRGKVSIDASVMGEGDTRGGYMWHEWGGAWIILSAFFAELIHGYVDLGIKSELIR